ncbi:hypothetical protein DSECCO2_624490 [anaerobic digester metagenome]
MSNTSINVLPIAFLFFSGSETPLNDSINLSPALTPMTFSPICLYESRTDSNSSFLKRPLSTNMQYRFFPIALLRRTAATVESTPPDKPNITLSFPSCDLRLLTVVSINDAGVQLPVHPQIFIAKFLSISSPFVV